MQKVVPIYIALNGINEIGQIVGINTNRIHDDLRVQKVGDKTYTKIRYYIDPAKNLTEELLTPESPNAIYREMDNSFDVLRVILPLVGGGTVSIATANIIYCYMDPATFERSSVDAFVGNRRTLYNLDMTFMELLTAINSPNETYWDDLRVPAQNTKLNPSKSEPAFESWIDGLFAYHFDNNNADDESIHFEAQIPHAYKIGTDLHPHIHWSPDNTNTGSVVWELEYTVASINKVFPATTTIQVVVAAGGVDDYHTVTELPVIDGANIGISAMIVCRLTRLGTDGADDYTGNAVFHEADFHIQLDSYGSLIEYVK